MNLNDRVFTSGQVAQMTGLSFYRIDYMAKSKLILPSACDGKGSSNCRGYTFADALAIVVISELRAFGFDLRPLKMIAKFLQNYDSDACRWGDCLIFTRKTCVILNSENMVAGVPRKATAFFPIADAVSELTEASEHVIQPSRGKAKVVAI